MSLLNLEDNISLVDYLQPVSLREMGWLNAVSFSVTPASDTESSPKEFACKYLIVKEEMSPQER